VLTGARPRQYGRVERLYIDVAGRQVFIKFTDGVSALRVSRPGFLAPPTPTIDLSSWAGEPF